MAPQDPAGIGPAETLSFLYRIESTAQAMATRPPDPNHPVTTDERAAWNTITALSNLMHAEFSAILDGSYDPSRHIALLITVIRLHEYHQLSGLIGVKAPPEVHMSHDAQHKGKSLSQEPWASKESNSWLEVLQQQSEVLPQHETADPQDLPTVSQILSAGTEYSPAARSSFSTDPASYKMAPIKARGAPVPRVSHRPPSSSSQQPKRRSKQKTSSLAPRPFNWKHQPSRFKQQSLSEHNTSRKSQVEGRKTQGKSHPLSPLMTPRVSFTDESTIGGGKDQDQPPEEYDSQATVSPPDSEESESPPTKRRKGSKTSHD